MNPEPLVRILPDVIFDHAREPLRVFANVGVGVSRAGKLHFRVKAKPVLTDGAVPMDENRDDRRARVQREPREPRSRAGGDTNPVL